jgi:hypothetical protein
MNMDVDDGAIERAYLDEVERAVAARDADAAQQIRAEIAAHIAESRFDAEERGESVSIHDIIAEIGDPLAVAAEVPVSHQAFGARESITGFFSRWEPMTYVWVVCLVITIVQLYFIGWVVGMVMMWTSPLWTRRVKIWATALIPGCLLAALLWFDFIFVAGYIAPVVIAVLLYFTAAPVKARRASRRAARRTTRSESADL